MTQLPELSGEAGAAFLLSEPAPLSLEFDHPEGRVIVRNGAANVTVNLLNSHGAEDVKAVAWRVIQESFDFLAARRRTVLSTAMGKTQCVLWSRTGNQYDVTCVATFVVRWSMNAQGTVGGASPACLQQSFTHHASLRFYRMSQCAQGLFDAYRNAYLALECLVSDVASKKQNEPELEWLKRVIRGPLAEAVPSGIDVESTLEAIYRHGRNPLFHAKSGHTFHPPHGVQTEEVHKLFEHLTLLLVSLLQYKFGAEVVSRWATMSRAAQDTQTRGMLAIDEVCFVQEAEKISVAPSIEIMESPRRFVQLWGKVSVTRPERLLDMTEILFLRQGKWQLQVKLDEIFGMFKVASVTFELNFVGGNLYAPKAFHPE